MIGNTVHKALVYKVVMKYVRELLKKKKEGNERLALTNKRMIWKKEIIYIYIEPFFLNSSEETTNQPCRLAKFFTMSTIILAKTFQFMCVSSKLVVDPPSLPLFAKHQPSHCYDTLTQCLAIHSFTFRSFQQSTLSVTTTVAGSQH